jgi:hypothetical protein
MVFSIGAVTLALFMARLLLGGRKRRMRLQPAAEPTLVAAE